MERRLFLTGPSGCGKSTMIQNALGDRVRQAGGFVTVRDRDENGKIRGFDLMLPDGKGEGQRFLDLAGKTPRLHAEVFRNAGVDCLRWAGERKFVLLDEIGGVELLDEDFINALAGFLQGSLPCIGVMKGPGPAGKLMEKMGMTVRYELARRALFEHLKHDPDTLLVEVTGPQDQAALDQVARWVAEYT